MYYIQTDSQEWQRHKSRLRDRFNRVSWTSSAKSGGPTPKRHVCGRLAQSLPYRGLSEYLLSPSSSSSSHSLEPVSLFPLPVPSPLSGVRRENISHQRNATWLLRRADTAASGPGRSGVWQGNAVSYHRAFPPALGHANIYREP
uniref:Uncharacterized protein n=1 Tax=Molossus molossus TaxID=27622 RepID=A0A7J8IZG8_MOLMO|nr:hypothetical protein HJG59_010374 [Molossus molossus]